MPRHYRRKTARTIASRHIVEDTETKSHSASPPRCLWRAMWWNKVQEDTLVLNASIYRENGGLVGEFYCFFNGERLAQLDARIADQSDREVLKSLLRDKAQVILKRCGITKGEMA